MTASAKNAGRRMSQIVSLHEASCHGSTDPTREHRSHNTFRGNLMTSKWLAAAGFVAATFITAGPAHADPDPVVFWNQILTQNVTGSPVLTSRTFSMVEVAIFEAANAST